MPKEVANRYLLKNALGEGRFGRVYRAKDYKTSKKVAVKMVSISSLKSLQIPTAYKSQFN